jgi:hypothetical protein
MFDEPKTPDIAIPLQNQDTPQPKHHVLQAQASASFLVFAEAALTIHKPLPEDSPFYAIVGRVASEWSHLEHILDLTILDLTGLRPELAACVTSQILGVGPRCKAISSLLLSQSYDKKLAKGFRSLAGDSYSVADWRARFVHDPWYLKIDHAGEQTATQFRAMPSIDPRYGFCEITKDEMDQTITAIKDLQATANGLREAVLSELRERSPQ